jgi:hypothetical protein
MVENEGGYIGQSQLRVKNATHHEIIQVLTFVAVSWMNVHEEPNYFVKYTKKSFKHLRSIMNVAICAIKYLITKANMDFINRTMQIVTKIKNKKS